MSRNKNLLAFASAAGLTLTTAWQLTDEGESSNPPGKIYQQSIPSPRYIPPMKREIVSVQASEKTIYLPQKKVRPLSLFELYTSFTSEAPLDVQDHLEIMDGVASRLYEPFKIEKEGQSLHYLLATGESVKVKGGSYISIEVESDRPTAYLQNMNRLGHSITIERNLHSIEGKVTGQRDAQRTINDFYWKSYRIESGKVTISALMIAAADECHSTPPDQTYPFSGTIAAYRIVEKIDRQLKQYLPQE